MKKLILILIVFIFSFAAQAGFVKYEDAVKVAIAHYHSLVVDNHTVVFEDMKFDCVSNPNIRTSNFKFYVFDFQTADNLGYVIVSSNDNIKPILSYSLEGNFDQNNISPAQKSFFDYFDACIDFVSTRNDYPVDENVASEWDFLLNYDYEKTRNSEVTSPILLSGILFNQSWPYNAACPKDSKSQMNGRVPVGCVAVAACQVMKYFNWPPQGQGKKTHNSNGGYGNITVNFDQETYNWDKVPVKATKKENDELSKICYHVGVAVEMKWGPEGSGAKTYNVAGILKKHFRYADNVKFVERDDYSKTAWEKLLIAEIDAKRPMVYKGADITDISKPAGHAWNCDGYQIKNGSTFFHMNWGWGGAGDNYCTLDELVSKAIGSGPKYDFVSLQGAVINIFPKAFADNPYPLPAGGIREIRGSEGSISDRSAASDYMINSETIYVIKPDNCGTIVNAYFLSFDIAEGDALYIYEGEGDAKILIDSYNKKNPPITSQSSNNKTSFVANGALTIKFITKDKGEAEGWMLNYNVENCEKKAKLFTNATGTFTDGSGESCDYLPSTSCMWTINPKDARMIKLDVNKLNLAEGDFLHIYKGNSMVEANRIANLTHDSPIDNMFKVGSVEDPVDLLTVHFRSKFNSPGAQGWEISYVSDGTSIVEESLFSNFYVLPNPGNNQSLINLEIEKTADYKISITNMTGQTLGTKEMSLSQGQYDFVIDEIANNKLENGVYIISLISENALIKTLRFVVFE